MMKQRYENQELMQPIIRKWSEAFPNEDVEEAIERMVSVKEEDLLKAKQWPLMEEERYKVFNRAERRKKIGSSPRYTQRKKGRKK